MSEKISRVRYNIDYFYSLFQKERRRYHPSLFDLGKETKLVRPLPVDEKLYKKIVSTYLRIYFLDLFFKFGATYFFLTGQMKLIRMKDNGKGFTRVGLFWFLRPSEKFSYKYCVLKKLTGKRNALPKIGQLWDNTFSPEILPILAEEFDKKYKSKTLHRKWKVD